MYVLTAIVHCAFLQVVKMGFASETARASVEDGSTASDALLAEYSITPGNLNQLRTPRTPASQDTVLQVYHTTASVLLSIIECNNTNHHLFPTQRKLKIS